MFFQNINYIVVIVAAVFGMAVGFVWYSPWAFGKAWMKAKGFTEESMKAKREGSPMAPKWILIALSTLVMSIIVAALFNSLVITSIGGMAILALSVWIGFVVPVKLGDLLFGGETLPTFLISVGHELLVLLVMSLIIGIWG